MKMSLLTGRMFRLILYKKQCSGLIIDHLYRSSLSLLLLLLLLLFITPSAH